MAEQPRPTEPKSAEQPEPPKDRTPPRAVPQKTLEEIVEEDRFEATDN
jgi:hypothetical protein